MKISKLFHWLYAFLMFLPIALFIPNAFYYGFNEHATNAETTTINYKYQSNEVSSLNDLIVGNIYNLNSENKVIRDLFTANPSYIGGVLLSDLDINSLSDADDYAVNFTTISSSTFIKISYDSNADYVLELYFDLTSFESGEYAFLFLYSDSFLSDCIIQLLDYSFIDPNYDIFSYTDYNVIESVNFNTNNTITNKMYQAWQSTWDLPLLQWTHNSFVSQPFTYITGLFGLQANNSLNYVFTYFCSISLIWLIFDVLMYVPLLCHRWLDKGVVE